jgi:hypothetical protein
MKPTATRERTDTPFLIAGLARLLLGGFLILIIGFLGYFIFEIPDRREALRQFQEYPLVYMIITLRTPQLYRYMIAPLAGTITVLLCSASYVRDIYALTQLRQGVKYVISSMFGFFIPKLTIDGGKKDIKKGETNLIDVMGGPGYVIIQPGNAVMFRELRKPSNISIHETYFLGRFETIGQIASLDEQQTDRDNIKALTRDGILITIKDVHFRYRLFPEVRYGQPKRRSIEDPYPFDEKALWNMAYNLSVDERGLESWEVAVSRAIVGGITDFINSHDVDYLTAPRQAGQDPRREMRHNLFNGPTRFGLRGLGAELLWVDIGHFAIEDNDDAVDIERTDNWAAKWLGDAQVKQAYGKARREAYQELGRAEAQADVIVAIAEALKDTDLGNDPVRNMTKALLLKSSQILEDMSDKGAPKEDKGEK